MDSVMAQADIQRAYRQRKRARAERMEAALVNIMTKLRGNEKPLAVELRALAEEGLV